MLCVCADTVELNRQAVGPIKQQSAAHVFVDMEGWFILIRCVGHEVQDGGLCVDCSFSSMCTATGIMGQGWLHSAGSLDPSFYYVYWLLGADMVLNVSGV